MSDPMLSLIEDQPQFVRKVSASVDVVRKALKRSKRPYVAFSGGKDSLCVLALVEAIRPDITIAWTDDELEYPETVEYQRSVQEQYGDQYVVTLGRSEHAGWFRPWTDQPYWRDPLPGSHRKTIPQDDWMAARGHDLTFTGVRAAESNARRMWLEDSGPLYRVNSGTGRRCCPLWDWTDDDVWALIAVEGLPVNPVYQRLTEIGVRRDHQRVGPLPLSPRAHLVDGWPEMLDRLEARYGRRWD